MTWYYLPNLSDTSHSVAGIPVLSSLSDSLVSPPEPWLTLSGTPTQRPLSWPGWKRRTWIRLLSGLTCAPSTLARGLAEWTSSLPGSRASRSPQPASSVALTTSVGSGLPSDGSSVSWDRDSCSWRTSPSLFDSGYLTSSPTLPSSGSMRSGVCALRPRLAHPTRGSASGSWPMPMASNGEQRSLNDRSEFSTTLVDAVQAKMWGTPVARDDQKSPEAHLAMKQRALGRTPDAAITSLTVQVKDWPTPTAHNPKDLGAPPSQAERNSHMLPIAAALHVSGPQVETTTPDGSSTSLKVDPNPRFVEALMGVPQNWLTPSTSVGTDSFQRWLRLHSLSWPAGSDSMGGEAA